MRVCLSVRLCECEGDEVSERVCLCVCECLSANVSECVCARATK